MIRRIGSAGLGYGQVFILIFGFLIASGVIFFLGFLVGQMRTEFRLAQEERVVRQAVPAQPTPSEEKEHDVDLAFYQKLKEKAYERLQETPTVAAAPVARAVPATAARGVHATHVVQAPAARGTQTPAPAPTRTPAHVALNPTALQAIPTARPKAEAPAPRDEWADAGWTVQVIATTDLEQAMNLARTLKTKGYEAYTVNAPMRGQTWYRVRVGRSLTRAKAKELEQRLKGDDLVNAYVTPQ